MGFVGRLISRYCIVTILPPTVVYLIYADYTRTQEYKKNKQNN